MGRGADAIVNETRRRVAVQNSGFLHYLETIVSSPDELSLPPAISDAFQTPLKRFPPQELYTFIPIQPEVHLGPNEPRSYNQIVREIQNSSMILVGESGIGKTSLLSQIAREYAITCQHHDSNAIPVLIRLSHYTGTNNLRALIVIHI